jgi:hypothetical protein
MDSSALTSPKRWQPHIRRASGHPGAISARQPASAAAAETPLERPWRIAEDPGDRHRVPNDPMRITAALFVITALDNVVGAKVT